MIYWRHKSALGDPGKAEKSEAASRLKALGRGSNLGLLNGGVFLHLVMKCHKFSFCLNFIPIWRAVAVNIHQDNRIKKGGSTLVT